MTARAYDPKKEPGGVRELTARWTITCTLEMRTAAQIGSHESDVCDQTFGRNEKGRPTLHGSTLTGALRNALNDWLKGYFEAEHPHASLLFGYVDVKDTSGNSAGEDEGPKLRNGFIQQESPLIVFDAEAEKPNPPATIRDGVRIDTKTGLADDGKKYDRELTLPGLVFPLRFDLLVGAKTKTDEKLDKKLIGGQEKEDYLLELLNIALNALTEEQIGLGARKRRGLGRCRASDFRARRYDLTTGEGWLAYCRSDHELPLKDVEPHVAFSDAVAKAFPRVKLPRSLASEPAEKDKRQKLRLDFNLELDGTLLIRSPGIHADDPDMVHLTEAGKAILSGTSLAGALRSHCVRILNTLGDNAQNGNNSNLTPNSDKERENFLDYLFGTAPERMRPGGSDIYASRVIVSECAVKAAANGREPVRYRQTRLKVDRFTGGPIDGALFEEVPVAGGQVTFTVDVQNPQEVDVALLLLAARDLTEGLLPIGGEASVGRGLFKGTVTATLPAQIEIAPPNAVTSEPTRTRVQMQAEAEAERRPPVLQSVTIDNGNCGPDEATALQPYLEALAAFAEGSSQRANTSSHSDSSRHQEVQP